MKKNLLIVEDDVFTRELLRRGMEGGGYHVYESGLLKRAIQIIDSNDIDLILLDLMLPDGEGLDFISDMRARTKAPVIIVSSNNDRSAKVTGLSRGADDYVVKPFNVPELVARVKANIRRYDSNSNMGATLPSLAFGKWVLDRKRFQVFDQNGTSANLTPQEYALLEILLEHANTTVRRWILCEALCAENYTLTEQALSIKITRLRKKIGECAERPQFLKTMRGVGYMYEGVVEMC